MHYAIIGTGYWGSNHVRVCAELLEDGVIDELTVCDADEGRVREIASSYDLPYLTDYGDLVSAGIDAVTVASPSPTHHEIATDLLRDGIDVLVEKPLALNSADAWDVVETAERQGCTLGVGHIFRYHPALNELKSRIDRGELGELRYLNTTRYSFRLPRRTAGVLYSLAIHDVDVYRHLLDREPDAVFCRTSSFIREGIDETATILLDYGELQGVINESWQVPVFGKRRDIVVVGSEKAAYVDYLRDTEVEIYESRVVERGESLTSVEEGVTVHETSDTEPLRNEVEDFVDSCRSGTPPLAAGHVGAEAVEILERAERSARSGQTVAIE